MDEGKRKKEEFRNLEFRKEGKPGIQGSSGSDT